MSADLLRRAAAVLREDWSEPWSDELATAAFHLAVADWLKAEAEEYDRYEGIWAVSHKDPRNRWGDLTPQQNLAHHFDDALAVARAYLGESA